MKKTLLQKIQESFVLSLIFTSFTFAKTKEGVVAVIKLDEPIDYLRGSQDYDVNGTKYPVEANDITEIRIHESEMKAAGDSLVWDEDLQTGSYNGEDFILDVAKGTKQVWLRRDTFLVSGQEYGRTQRAEKIQKLAGLSAVAPKKENLQPVDTDK